MFNLHTHNPVLWLDHVGSQVPLMLANFNMKTVPTFEPMRQALRILEPQHEIIHIFNHIYFCQNGILIAMSE